MFSSEALGCALERAHPLVLEPKMKSRGLTPTGKASDNSFKSTSVAPSMTFTSTQYDSLSLDTPESKNARQAKQAFLNKTLESKVQFLLSGNPSYQPQAALLIPGLFSLKDTLRQQLTDSAISQIEGIVALYGALCSVNDSAGFLCVLTIYAKTFSQEALTSQLTQLVGKLFSGYEPQSSSDKPEWLTQLSSALHDWKLLVNNPAFTKISRVVSLLVTLGVIENTSLHLGGFEIFAIEAQKKQCNAVDLIDAMIETIVFFAEGGYQCFVTGSLAPLLFSTPKLVELEEKYISKVEQWEHARNGNLERFLSISEAEFDKELKELVEEFHMMYKTMPNGTEKKIIQQKWESLSKILTEFTSVRISGGLRKAPLAVKIYGNSGVGKSTFADLTMVTVLKAMDLPCTSDYICTLNASDKYMSNYRSYITGVKIDDLGNNKKEFWEVAPSESIIRIVNNIREYAVMADIANKGKISIEPGCLTITTNVEELHAGISSYNSMSVLRRCHIHVELKVRPEFMTNNLLDSAKVLDHFGSLDKLNDIWLITLKRPIGDGPTGQAFSSYEILKTDISITEYLNIIIAKAKSHNAQQQSIVESFKEPADIVSICSTCNRVSETCTCPVLETVEEEEDEEEEEDDYEPHFGEKLDHKICICDICSQVNETCACFCPEIFEEKCDVYEPHFGERLAHQITTRASKFHHDLRIGHSSVETQCEDFAISTLIKFLKAFEESPYSSWTAFIPEQWMENDFIKSTIITMGEDVIGTDMKTYTRRMAWSYFLTSIPIFSICGFKITQLFLILGFIHYLLTYSTIVETKKTAYMQHLIKSRDVLPQLFKDVRDKHVKYACGAFGALAILYAAAQTYKALRSNLSLQGSLRPKSMDDIRKRDLEADVWKPAPDPVPMGNDGSWSSIEQAAAGLKANQYIVEVGDQFSGAICLQTKIFAMPAHLLPAKPTTITLKGRCYTIKTLLSPEYAIIIPNTDMAVFYVPNAFPSKNILVHFEPNYVRHPIMASMIGVSYEGEQYTARTLWSFAHGVSNGPYAFPGSYYDLASLTTAAGMCMSPIVSDSKSRKILGFHIGGVTGTPKGCGFAITTPQLELAINQLLALSKTFLAAPQATDIPDTLMGKKIVEKPTVHAKCPTNFITGEPALVAYGSVIGRSHMTSAVIDTPISKTVEQVTGVPNNYGPPRFTDPVLKDGYVDKQKWKPWYASLEVCSKPSIGFPTAQVDQAIDDYLVDLKEQFDAIDYGPELRPLNHQETISGIDGKRFIDAMITKTSIGYPIGGPKSKHMIDLEPTADHSCPRDFTPEIQAEIARVLTCADADESLNLIFGANLKDEPTKTTKEKVRVYQAAPLALQYALRMYFLPPARFLSLNPLISECAVGINAHGPQWDELSRHMAHFGEDRIIAGDYSKYDLRMPAQLTLSAFSVMIEIAKWSGNYSDQELKRMRVLAHEVCTPLVAYNGTLLRFLGTNPSGQNLTVYINSIVNSVLHRICFFDEYSEKDLIRIGKELGLGRPARFRDLVTLATYGDDAKGSVRVGYDRFNHCSMANLLAENDMKFTMPDKESDPVPFMSRQRADFLKRKDRYDEDLGHYVGELDEESIFKSLHSILKPTTQSALEVATSNVDGALREWFFHGREVFDFRLAQMKEIARIENLPCTTLDQTFDDRVKAWKTKYVPLEV
jgi:hypothetical protein